MTIAQLVFDFFDLCELNPIEIRQGVWQVQVDEALMKELDGWRAQARLLQFTFDKNKAETFGADFISPGSYRFNSILNVIQKQGILSHAHIPFEVFHEPNIRKKILNNLGSQKRAYVVNNAIHYTQYLVLNVAVQSIGLSKQNRIQKSIVDLSTGEILKFVPSAHLIRGGCPANATIRKRKFSLKRAYENVGTMIYNEIMAEDQTWIEQAWAKLESEQKQLDSFFEGASGTPEYLGKSKELENRFVPKIQIDAIRGAILYVPIFFYRLMVVEPDGKEKIQTIYYDPINNQLQ